MAEKRTVVMVLKHTSRIVSRCLLATTLCVGVLQAQRSAYDPATQGAPAQPKQGFVDYTLKRINPSDKDFGECVDQGRKLIMQESIQNGYFWSNVVTLSLLGCLFNYCRIPTPAESSKGVDHCGDPSTIWGFKR